MAKSGAAGHAANRNKAVRVEAMREQLAAKGLEQKVLEDIDLLRDLASSMDAIEVARIKHANDLRMKLLGKVFPDLKSVEVSGQDGGPIGVTWVNPQELSTDALRELLAQREKANG